MVCSEGRALEENLKWQKNRIVLSIAGGLKCLMKNGENMKFPEKECDILFCRVVKAGTGTNT